MTEKFMKKIVTDYKAFASNFEVKDIQFIPISALLGDNVVDRSEDGLCMKVQLFFIFLKTYIGSDNNHIDCRFPVQYVIRPQSDLNHDYRGYAGRIAGEFLNREMK